MTTRSSVPPPIDAPVAASSLGSDVHPTGTWAMLRRNRIAMGGAVVLACVALVAVFADLFAAELPLFLRWRHSTGP